MKFSFYGRKEEGKEREGKGGEGRNREQMKEPHSCVDLAVCEAAHEFGNNSSF